jgi:membrane protease YdiL (CAAX protease family)
VAPLWHTVVLVVVIFATSWAGAASNHGPSSETGKIFLYSATIVWQLILTGFVIFGLRFRNISVREVIGGRWDSFEKFLLDVALAAAFWITAAIILGAIGYAMGMSEHAGKLSELRKQLEFMAPRTLRELAVFCAVSITAGFCEEIIFRGYLQRQLGLLTRNYAVGIALAGVIFGAAHAYEGAQRMVLIGIYGMMFGVLAHFRKSLRPGMMAHAFHDIASGAALFFMFR